MNYTVQDGLTTSTFVYDTILYFYQLAAAMIKATFFYYCQGRDLHKPEPGLYLLFQVSHGYFRLIFSTQTLTFYRSLRAIGWHAHNIAKQKPTFGNRASGLLMSSNHPSPVMRASNRRILSCSNDEERPNKRNRSESDVSCNRRTVSALAPMLQKLIAVDPLSVIQARQSLRKKVTQREYDEGMHAYPDALPLPECAHMRRIVAFYNMSLQCVRHGNYHEGLRGLELTALRLAVSDSNEESLSFWIQHNMGYCHYRMADYEGALQCYCQALQIPRESLDHATTYNCIGVLLFHQNAGKQCQDALHYFVQAQEIYETKLPADSSTLATVLNNIGRVHYLQGEYTTALQVYQRALRIRRQSANPLDVAATVCNTGQTHQQLGSLDEAMALYQEFLAMAYCGANHRDVAIIMKCMAEIHHQEENLKKALEMYEKAMNITKRAGGSQQEFAAILNKLGNLRYEMASYDEALKCYAEGLALEELIYNQGHPHVIVTLMNIAQIHRHQGDFKVALQYYKKIYERTVASVGAESIEAASAMSNMALMHYQLKSHEVAFELYQDALRIQRDYHGSDETTEIASSLNSIGLVLFQQGAHDLAKDCFYDSLRIRTKLLGPDHRDVAVLWYNIATINLETGDDEEALRCYKETLRVERKSLGDGHNDVLLTLQHLGLVHQQRGELDEALNYFGQALESEKMKESPGTPLAKLLNLIGNIHLQRADVPAMMTFYSDALRIYESLKLPFDNLVIAGYNLYGLTKSHPACASCA